MITRNQSKKFDSLELEPLNPEIERTCRANRSATRRKKFASGIEERVELFEMSQPRNPVNPQLGLPLNPPEGHVEDINDDDGDFIINNGGNNGANGANGAANPPIGVVVDPLHPIGNVQRPPQQEGWQQGFIPPQGNPQVPPQGNGNNMAYLHDIQCPVISVSPSCIVLSATARNYDLKTL